jgi:L-aspartate oxidase
MVEPETTDFLVVGSGIAGLSFSIKAAKLGNVILVTKKQIIESNTNLAQGGIASVIDSEDSYQAHIDDTVRTGCGLSDIQAVDILVKNGPQVINWLIAEGVRFDQDQGTLSLSREGGHSANRIIHSGDYTGNEIERALVSSIKELEVEIRENTFALDLIIHKDHCYGAKVLDLLSGTIQYILSKVTILSTGGVGQLYHNTSNPEIATGDGIAMALRAGAKIADMEFIQFHPTTMNLVDAPNFLLSETVRGEGGLLRNVNGVAFMKQYDPRGDLAPRDVVSRAVYKELTKGPVFLDITHKGEAFLKNRFPMIYQECLKHGFDLTNDQIPIVPAAHYICGGIKVDHFGESSLLGLFSFGESSCTGVHGANRLASNSLLESAVFSSLAIKAVTKYLKQPIPIETLSLDSNLEVSTEHEKIPELRKKLQQIMWDHVSIMRSETGLSQALKELAQLNTRTTPEVAHTVNTAQAELANMLTLAPLIIRAALIRKESRGTHYMVDYPQRDDSRWLGRIVFEKDQVQMEPLSHAPS